MNILDLVPRWWRPAGPPAPAQQGRPQEQPRNRAGKWPDTTGLLVQRMTGMHFDPAQLGNDTSKKGKEPR